MDNYFPGFLEKRDNSLLGFAYLELFILAGVKLAGFACKPIKEIIKKFDLKILKVSMYLICRCPIYIGNQKFIESKTFLNVRFFNPQYNQYTQITIDNNKITFGVGNSARIVENNPDLAHSLLTSCILMKSPEPYKSEEEFSNYVKKMNAELTSTLPSQLDYNFDESLQLDRIWVVKYNLSKHNTITKYFSHDFHEIAIFGCHRVVNTFMTQMNFVPR